MNRRAALRVAAAVAGSAALRPATGATPAPHLHGASGVGDAPRSSWLAQAEAALARLDADTAEQDFERAAALGHTADAELGVARTHLQRGHYGLAVNLTSHLAGHHREAVGGAVLHAWLLQLVGNTALAASVLDDAALRHPDSPLPAAVRTAWRSPEPVAGRRLLAPPLRLAPYGAAVTGGRASVASGLLAGDGRRALVPAQTVGASAGPGVRDGLGRFSPTRVEQRLPGLDLAVVRLERPLPATDLVAAPRDAFPGSVAHAVRYARSADASPRWPLLSSGFVGAPMGDGAGRRLDFIAASASAGPVFDASGRLVGVAIAGRSGAPARLVAFSQIDAATQVPLLQRAPPPGSAPRVGIDRVYELALRAALQVVA